MLIFGPMARIMAIDFGTKRVGLAVTDPMQIIATGLTTVSNREALEYIKSYLAKEEVEAFVVGEPLNMDDTASAVAPEVERFISALAKLCPNIPIYREDERYTSKMAMRTLIDSGLKKKARRNKALLDEVSATIILQSYLERNSN